MAGGTILNLCKKLGNINTISELNELIARGNLKNIDLTIEDITNQKIDTLPKNTTSANFGKLSENATREDLCLGILNMVFEAVGVMAIFGAQNIKYKNIIVVGNVACMPYINTVLNKIEKLHMDSGIKFMIPQNAEFATVLGAIEAAN